MILNYVLRERAIEITIFQSRGATLGPIKKCYRLHLHSLRLECSDFFLRPQLPSRSQAPPPLAGATATASSLVRRLPPSATGRTATSHPNPPKRLLPDSASSAAPASCARSTPAARVSSQRPPNTLGLPLLQSPGTGLVSALPPATCRAHCSSPFKGLSEYHLLSDAYSSLGLPFARPCRFLPRT